ncbi:DUF4362 domain-containing protein [Bacillus pseudomycoides]|uniref:DUF4362 domain-containing protein n=1 Tax=Bacillus pseudomycoides TaxID=64104 RepID=A0A2B6K8H4_9BACI|nr:DUF4362 domain-containing protein [Bacillus pseudomycoides]PEA83521.1 hypothetical protein CON99_11175 [Bacillus pseudomycoides]PED73110.1 hypothetical protein CON97_04920 [Bacillus pseudomycoides]PEI42317.1 hypothetical protein CN620_09745 [Bacillus pseudomycoides]PEJ68861.1 hypothetical protein CN680_25860 [Bacillus pseudomycoides]PEM11308.1 hypothetical protein CN628_21965 [Bacillus pseudomycoides]
MRTGIASLCFLFCIGSLVACSQSGGKIDENNDVIAKGHKISNLHKFEKFFMNVEKGRADKICIVNYTHEGDPIFQTLEYDGREISYKVDNSYDKFTGKDKGIYSDTCKKIMKDTREDIGYTLHDCVKETGHNGYDLFRIPAK